MKHTPIILIIGFIFTVSCGKEETPRPLPSPDGPMDIHNILLKDMIVKNLPSPYYHFEYNDSGFITRASWQSGFNVYNLFYSNGRISQMQNNTAVNKDRLTYVYEKGLVAQINFTNEAGVTFKKSSFTYNASKQLTKVDWTIITTDGSNIPERSMQLEYYADGNLATLNDHMIEIPGIQPDAVYTDTYENYDNKSNADAFALIHKIDDHLILLPGIVLQKNNPQKETRSGDGLHYAITYTYTYRDSLPIKKDGDMVILNGDGAGTHTNYNISFSYY